MLASLRTCRTVRTMLVTTTTTLHGVPGLEYLGIVSGSAALGPDTLRNVYSEVSTSTEPKENDSGTRIEEAVGRALDVMTVKAEDLGADAVIGVSVVMDMVASGSLLVVLVSGTAVRRLWA